MSKSKKTQPDNSKWFEEYNQWYLAFQDWLTRKKAHAEATAESESGSNPGNPPPPPPPPAP